MRADNLTVKTREDLEQIKKEQGINEDLYILHADTGECEELENGAKIIHPKKKRKNKKGEYLVDKFKKKELFVKVYKMPVEVLGKELTNRDFAWFMRLIPYIHMEDCVLYDDEKKEYLTIRRISELMEVNYDNLCTVFKGYKDKGLIADIERPSLHDGYKTVMAIVVNPYILMNGKCLLEQTNNIFNNLDWHKRIVMAKNCKKDKTSKTA